MGGDHKEWSARAQIRAISMIQGFFGRKRVEQYLLLFFQYDRSTVVVAMQVQMDAVVHKVSTA
jgi:hypothetical protein